MSEPTLSLGINKQICDADGCSAIATEEIKISIGPLGDIELSICKNCKPKFVDREFLTHHGYETLNEQKVKER